MKYYIVFLLYLGINQIDAMLGLFKGKLSALILQGAGTAVPRALEHP